MAISRARRTPETQIYTTSALKRQSVSGIKSQAITLEDRKSYINSHPISCKAQNHKNFRCDSSSEDALNVTEHINMSKQRAILVTMNIAVVSEATSARYINFCNTTSTEKVLQTQGGLDFRGDSQHQCSACLRHLTLGTFRWTRPSLHSSPCCSNWYHAQHMRPGPDRASQCL